MHTRRESLTLTITSRWSGRKCQLRWEEVSARNCILSCLSSTFFICSTLSPPCFAKLEAPPIPVTCEESRLEQSCKAVYWGRLLRNFCAQTVFCMENVGKKCPRILFSPDPCANFWSNITVRFYSTYIATKLTIQRAAQISRGTTGNVNQPRRRFQKPGEMLTALLRKFHKVQIRLRYNRKKAIHYIYLSIYYIFRTKKPLGAIWSQIRGRTWA